MANNPTYDGLIQRVKELEREVADLRGTEKSIPTSRDIINAMIDGIIVFDSFHRVVFTNQTFLRMFGLKSHEIIGKNIMELPGIERQKQEDLKTFIPILKKAELEGASGPFEMIIMTQDKRKLPVSVAGGTTRASKGSPHHFVAVVRDITERKKADEALKESQEQYRDLVETVNDMIWEIDTDGCYSYVSPRVKDILGYEPQELLGKPFTDQLQGHESARVSQKFAELVAKQIPFESLETTATHKDGHLVILENSGKPFFNADGQLLGFRGVDRDISERKWAEEALRQSEERLQAIIDNTTAVIYLKDRQGKYILINRQYEVLCHITKEQIIDKTDYDIFSKEVSDALRENDRKVLEIDGPLEFEEIVPHDDGIHTYISIKFPLKDSSGFSYGACGISTDITERKKVEKHIRALTQQLIKAQEIEWKRISRELHDHVAQDLAASKMACSLLLESEEPLVGGVKQNISKISHMLGDAITTVRNLAYNLRPQDVEELGLIQSIFNYCNDFSEKSGVDVDFSYAGVESLNLSLDAEINIFRLIQEGLNNIWKHADAGKATVRLVGAFPNIILRIEDNGKGFDVKQRMTQAVEEKRMGLRNMEERVRLLHGRMEIHSKPEVGTIISIKFPNKENKDVTQPDRISP